MYQDIDGVEGKSKEINDISSLALSGVRNGKFDTSNVPEDQGYLRSGTSKFVKSIGKSIDFMADNEEPGWVTRASDEIKKSSRGKAQKWFNDAKKEFPETYKNSKNDKEFIEKAKGYQIANTVLMNQYVGLDSPDAIKNLFSKFKNEDKAFVDPSNPNKYISKSQFIKEAEDNGIKGEDLYLRQTLIDGNGDMTIEMPANEKGTAIKKYKINKESLADNLKGNEEVISDFRKAISNYELTPEQIQQINTEGYEVGGNVYRVIINPSNIMEPRKVFRVNMNTGENIRVSPAEVQQSYAMSKLSGLGRQVKVKATTIK
jgi:hypothetical protein